MRAILTALMLIIASQAGAAEFFVLPSTSKLLMMGKTTTDDFSTIKRYIDDEKITEILLKGPGGNLHSAFAIADLILEANIDTTVIEKTECASACSLIFSAGNKRHMEVGSKLGFHLPFADINNNYDLLNYCKSISVQNPQATQDNFANLLASSWDGADVKCITMTYQMGLRDIRKLMKVFDRDGISPKVLDFIIDTYPTEMRWVSVDLARSLGLIN
jgi:hypothetical protein